MAIPGSTRQKNSGRKGRFCRSSVYLVSGIPKTGAGIHNRTVDPICINTSSLRCINVSGRDVTRMAASMACLKMGLADKSILDANALVSSAAIEYESSTFCFWNSRV